MTILNIGSIEDRIKTRVNNIPSGTGDIGSGSGITFLIEGIINDINGNEKIQSSITETNIEPKFQNILVNLGCAYTLANINDTGVGFDYDLEGFKVKKSGDTVSAKKINFYLDEANKALGNIGVKVNYGKVNG